MDEEKKNKIIEIVPYIINALMLSAAVIIGALLINGKLTPGTIPTNSQLLGAIIALFGFTGYNFLMIEMVVKKWKSNNQEIQ